MGLPLPLLPPPILLPPLPVLCRPGKDALSLFTLILGKDSKHGTVKISLGLCRTFKVHYYQRSEWIYRVLCSDSCCSSDRFPVLPPLLSSFFPRSLRSALWMRRQQDEVTKASGQVMTINILFKSKAICLSIMSFLSHMSLQWFARLKLDTISNLMQTNKNRAVRNRITVCSMGLINKTSRISV